MPRLSSLVAPQFVVTTTCWHNDKPWCCQWQQKLAFLVFSDRKEWAALHNEAEWRVHIWVRKLAIIGSDNGLSPGRPQAIIWTNAGLLLIGSVGTNFGKILIEIHIFHWRKSIWNCRLDYGGHFCIGLNVLRPTLWKCIPIIMHTVSIL